MGNLMKTNLGGKTIKYPEKTQINLVRFETEKSHSKDILIILLILLCLIAFAKYGVYDEFLKLQAAQKEYSVVQGQLIDLRQANSNYEDVKKEYDRVTEWYMTEEEKSVIDKLDVLKMLEEDLMPYVEVMNLSVAGTMITAQTGYTNLETVAEFLLKLQSDSRNRTATVTTTAAAGQKDKKENVVATVMIDFIGGTENTTGKPSEAEKEEPKDEEISEKATESSVAGSSETVTESIATSETNETATESVTASETNETVTENSQEKSAETKENTSETSEAAVESKSETDESKKEEKKTEETETKKEKTKETESKEESVKEKKEETESKDSKSKEKKSKNKKKSGESKKKGETDAES